MTVRLVKGAYWDTETVVSRAEGWPVPVYERKAETDASFERCVRLLHDHRDEVRAAFGSHNLRSLAYAVTYARSKGIPDTGYEMQMLYGMAEPIHAAIRRMGLRLRVYAPVGELVPGMAYLVRRLLENTSNESFVRRRFAEGRALDDLLAPPAVQSLPELEVAPLRVPTDEHHPTPYEPEPPAEWRRAQVRTVFAAAVARTGSGGLGREVPAMIGGHAVMTRSTIASVDPAQPSVRVASSASCGVREADEAMRDRDQCLARVATYASGRARRGPVPRRRVDAGAPRTIWLRWRCSKRASRGRKPTPTSARPSTSASTTGAR